MAEDTRSSRFGNHRQDYEKNRALIIQRGNTCALCGKPVDKKIKYPHPMCPTVDHIIPIAKGGHPSDINNLQLTHFYCNRMKSDSITQRVVIHEDVGCRDLPKMMDWEQYRFKGGGVSPTA